MKRQIIVSSIVVGLSLCAFAKTSTPVGWIDDYDAALKQAAAEKKLVLADFSGSDWCGWCKRLDKEVFDTEMFRKGATNSFVLLMVDSPSDQSLLSEKAKKQNPKLVEKFGIRGFPTVLVLDAKGETVFKTGYQPGGPEKYLKMLEDEIKFGPDIKKYIKPIEEIINKSDEVPQKEMMEFSKSLDAKYPAKADETVEERKARYKKGREESERHFFTVVAPKYLPLAEKALAEAKAMKVPNHLKDRKDALIDEHEQSIASLKEAMSKFEKGEQKEL